MISATDHTKTIAPADRWEQNGFFEKGVEADLYLTAFTVKYNKVYSRRYPAYGKAPQELRGKDMSAEAFTQWSKLSQQARSGYLEGKLSGEEMLEKLRWNRKQQYQSLIVLRFGTAVYF